jgi:hypothetical protein
LATRSDRDLVSIFDALLVVVLALALYGMSARDPLELSGFPHTGPITGTDT